MGRSPRASTSSRPGPAQDSPSVDSLRIPAQRTDPHAVEARGPVRAVRPLRRPGGSARAPCRADDAVRDPRGRVARRPEVRPAAGARAPAPDADRVPRQPERLARGARGGARRHRRRRPGAELGHGQDRPAPARQRVADEHPQPRDHRRRHLRVRPALLPRVAEPADRSAAARHLAPGPRRSARCATRW